MLRVAPSHAVLWPECLTEVIQPLSHSAVFSVFRGIAAWMMRLDINTDTTVKISFTRLRDSSTIIAKNHLVCHRRIFPDTNSIVVLQHSHTMVLNKNTLCYRISSYCRSCDPDIKRLLCVPPIRRWSTSVSVAPRTNIRLAAYKHPQHLDKPFEYQSLRPLTWWNGWRK